MTDCREIFALLSQYLDRELPPEICDQIEKHIGDCPPCIDFVRSLRTSIDLYRRYRDEERPGPLPSGVREELLAAYRKMIASRDCR